jgi:outer membrane protein, heavy metal efflux system
MNVAAKLLINAVMLAALVAARPLDAGVEPESALGPPEDSLLSSLIEETLQNNPVLAASREAAAAARSRPPQARSLPNPMLVASYTNDGISPSLGSRDMTTLALMWGQEIPFAGKRGLRGDVLARTADEADQQVERVKLDLTARVKRAYYDLLLSRDLLDLIREQAEVWRQTEGVIRARYAVGRGAQQDVLRAQVEVVRVERLRIEREAEVEIRVAEVNHLLDRPAGTPLATEAHLVLRPIEKRLEPVLDRLVASSPEVKNAAIEVARSGLGVALAQKEFKPDFALQGGYMNRGRLDPMWIAGVGISVPLYRERLKSGLAEAEAESRSSERLVDWVQLVLRFRTEERLAQLAATEKIAVLYGDGIVPQDRLSVEAAMASYQTGQVPFVTVLEALTTLYNDLANHFQVLANYEKIHASLEEASLEQTSSLSMGGATMPTTVGTGMAAGGASMGGGRTSSGSGVMSNR